MRTYGFFLILLRVLACGNLGNHCHRGNHGQKAVCVFVFGKFDNPRQPKYHYKGLLRDINRSYDDISHYSDGYDIAQEAMLFLCQHMGERLDDVYYTKTGRKITIKQACFSVADRYLAKNYVTPMLNTTSLNEQDCDRTRNNTRRRTKERLYRF